MASNLIASNLEAMASNLIAMASTHQFKESNCQKKKNYCLLCPGARAAGCGFGGTNSRATEGQNFGKLYGHHSFSCKCCTVACVLPPRHTTQTGGGLRSKVKNTQKTYSNDFPAKARVTIAVGTFHQCNHLPSSTAPWANCNVRRPSSSIS